tara:strand:+ start:77 stop:637 length:561 start_codon:yes stop_codon:yes gene_type:complete
MKKLLIIITTIALSSIVNAEVRYVTLKAQGDRSNDEKEFEPIDSFECAPTDLIELVRYNGDRPRYWWYLDGSDKRQWAQGRESSNSALEPITNATKIELDLSGRDEIRIYTFRITTKSSYSISKEDLISAASSGGTSVVIPEDADGTYEVVLESSTDMVTWTRANPGTYGGDTKKRFFRTRVIKKG